MRRTALVHLPLQRPALALAAILLASLLFASSAGPSAAKTRSERNEALLARMRDVHHLSDAQVEALGAIFSGSQVMGQGNDAISVHPMTPEQCEARAEETGTRYENPEFEQICGAPYMAPLYDPATETPSEAPACIDQFEFPDIPCTYPVVWVRAREAALACEAMGKRLCDAHEWEGACAGSLEAPDYRFDLVVKADPSASVRAMRAAHNRAYASKKNWSYGPEYQTGVCAAASFKTEGCEGGGWSTCGSNTYPTGSFPGCRSSLMVYDLNGNAAEHMNLPLDPSQMASRGSKELGYTEMKGSWFIFDSYKAHDDWCRWRAPFWHGSRVMDPNSHHNYHLGFRCCKTLSEPPAR